MRVVTWNPMSATGGRLTEIDMGMKNESVVILSGTQMRQRWGRSNEKCSLDHFHVTQLGHAQGKYTKKFSGGAILLNKKKSKEENIVAVEVPGKELRGRGGCIRYKSRHYDLLIMFLYFPPVVHRKREEQKYVQTVNELASWAEKVIARLPARSKVLIGTDLNNQLGLGGQEEDPDLQPCVGGRTGGRRDWPAPGSGG